MTGQGVRRRMMGRGQAGRARGDPRRALPVGSRVAAGLGREWHAPRRRLVDQRHVTAVEADVVMQIGIGLARHRIDPRGPLEPQIVDDDVEHLRRAAFLADQHRAGGNEMPTIHIGRGDIEADGFVGLDHLETMCGARERGASDLEANGIFDGDDAPDEMAAAHVRCPVLDAIGDALAPFLSGEQLRSSYIKKKYISSMKLYRNVLNIEFRDANSS